MLRYLYADELSHFPKLATSMYQDRADQFKTRLGWDVQINEAGEEKDLYDDLNPLYVIWEEPDGTHGGSMRFLPTTGPVMINDVFGHIVGGNPIRSPKIWEVTRFCLSRRATSIVAGAIMLSGGEVMNGFGLTHIAGVFDERMIRIYRLIGSSPNVVGCEGEGRDRVYVGVWPYSPADCERVAKRAGVSRELSRIWFKTAFGGIACNGTSAWRSTREMLGNLTGQFSSSQLSETQC